MWRLTCFALWHQDAGLSMASPQSQSLASMLNVMMMLECINYSYRALSLRLYIVSKALHCTCDQKANLGHGALPAYCMV